jgi:hypothetical protein
LYTVSLERKEPSFKKTNGKKNGRMRWRGLYRYEYELSRGNLSEYSLKF